MNELDKSIGLKMDALIAQGVRDTDKLWASLTPEEKAQMNSWSEQKGREAMVYFEGSSAPAPAPTIPEGDGMKLVHDDGTEYSQAEYEQALAQVQQAQKYSDLYEPMVAKLVENGFGTDEEVRQLLAKNPRVMAELAQSGAPTTTGGWLKLAKDLALDFVSRAGRMGSSLYETGMPTTDEEKNRTLQEMSKVDAPIGNWMQEIAKSPVTPFSGAIGKVAGSLVGSGAKMTGAMGQMAKLKPFASLQLPTTAGNITQGALTGATAGVLGAGAEDLSRTQEGITAQADLTAKDYALAGGVGGSLGGAGGAIGSLFTRSTQIPATANIGEIGNLVESGLQRANPKVPMAQLQSQADQIQASTQLAQSGLSKQANAVGGDWARLVKTPEDAQALKELTRRAEVGIDKPITIADEEGARILKKAYDITDGYTDADGVFQKGELQRSGEIIGEIDQKYLNNTKPALSAGGVINAWQKTLVDKVGLRVVIKADGTAKLVPISGSNKITEKNGAWGYLEGQTNELLKASRNGMTPQSLRNQEQLLRRSLPTLESRTDQSWPFAEDAVSEFHQITKEQVKKSLKTAGATPDELKAYDIARRDYRDYSIFRENIERASGDAVTLPANISRPDDAEIFARGGTFLQRLTSQTGTQTARPVATFVQRHTGEDVLKTARLTKLAMESAGDVMRSGAKMRGGMPTTPSGLMSTAGEALQAQTASPSALKQATAERMTSPMRDVKLNFGQNPASPTMMGVLTPSATAGTKNELQKMGAFVPTMADTALMMKQISKGNK